MLYKRYFILYFVNDNIYQSLYLFSRISDGCGTNNEMNSNNPKETLNMIEQEQDGININKQVVQKPLYKTVDVNTLQNCSVDNDKMHSGLFSVQAESLLSSNVDNSSYVKLNSASSTATGIVVSERSPTDNCYQKDISKSLIGNSLKQTTIVNELNTRQHAAVHESIADEENLNINSNEDFEAFNEEFIFSPPTPEPIDIEQWSKGATDINVNTTPVGLLRPLVGERRIETREAKRKLDTKCVSAKKIRISSKSPSSNDNNNMKSWLNKLKKTSPVATSYFCWETFKDNYGKINKGLSKYWLVYIFFLLYYYYS